MNVSYNRKSDARARCLSLSFSALSVLMRTSGFLCM